MSCKRQDLAEKLVLYTENLASQEERTQIEAHLQECESCREEVGVLKENIGLIKKGSLIKTLSQCPEEDILVTLSEAPDSIPEAQRKRLQSHINYCGTCRETFALLRELDTELKTGEDAAQAQVKMPASMKEAVENLYGKKEDRQPGFLEKLVQAFNLRPRYSLFSAIAVVLLLVGVLSILFTDLAYRSEITAPTTSQKLQSTVAMGERDGFHTPGSVELRKREGKNRENVEPSMKNADQSHTHVAITGDEETGNRLACKSRAEKFTAGEVTQTGPSSARGSYSGGPPPAPASAPAISAPAEESCHDTITYADNKENKKGIKTETEKLPADKIREKHREEQGYIQQPPEKPAGTQAKPDATNATGGGGAGKTSNAGYEGALTTLETAGLIDDDRKKELNREARDIVNRALGVNSADITIEIIPDEKGKSSSRQKVKIIVKSKKALTPAEKKKITEEISREMMLEERQVDIMDEKRPATY